MLVPFYLSISLHNLLLPNLLLEAALDAGKNRMLWPEWLVDAAGEGFGKNTMLWAEWLADASGEGFKFFRAGKRQPWTPKKSVAGVAGMVGAAWKQH